MILRLLTVLFPLQLVLAFYSNAPALIWSSPSAHTFLPTFGSNVSDILDLGDRSICELNVIVLIEHPGLQSRDLRTSYPLLHEKRSGPKSHSRFLNSLPLSSDELTDASEALAKLCGFNYRSEHLKHSEEVLRMSLPEDGSLSHYKVPEIFETGSPRRHELQSLDASLSRYVSATEDTYSKYLILYVGSLPTSHNKRQFSEEEERVPFSKAAVDADAGILKQYQLLTPGLIVTLLIVFFLVFPVILLSVRALASIQSPLRLDTAKSSSVEKKTQ